MTATRDAAIRMSTAAQICEAAMRDAFNIELDGSLDSLVQVDACIDHGLASDTPGMASPEETILVIAAYWGQVLVHPCSAHWVASPSAIGGYMLSMPSHSLLSPFELVAKKLCAPWEVSLYDQARSVSGTLEQGGAGDFRSER